MATRTHTSTTSRRSSKKSSEPGLKLRALEAAVAKSKKGLAWFEPGRTVRANDTMQKISYKLAARRGRLQEPAGRAWAQDFKPDLTPSDMLELGVFSGKYLNDCVGELPREWFERALKAGKLRPDKADPKINLFEVKSRKSLQYWRDKGWIPIVPGDKDVRGWFQWYCRYWLGRRDAAVDEAQIKRWRAFRRHAGQIRADYERMRERGEKPPATRAQKMKHRARQRQALLQWAYDPWI